MISLKQIFCVHDYTITNQFSTDSEFEQLIKANKVPNTHTSFAKKFIVDFKCSKCNKIHRKTTRVY